MSRVLSKDKLKKIIKFARKIHKQKDFSHNISHVYLTVRIAKVLAKKEGANIEICEAASYLHDIGREKGEGKHGVIGAKKARQFLINLKLPLDFIDDVCYAIARHDSGYPKKSIEAKVLWDADKLQTVGPFGFYRIFGHYLLYNTKDINVARRKTQERHKFFYHRFYTKTGKALAKKLHGFMLKFHEMLELIRSAKIERI